MSYYNASADATHAETSPPYPYGVAQTYGTTGHNSIVKPVPGYSFKRVFATRGAILLALLMVSPVWNAFRLLQDESYIFWSGPSLPLWILFICVVVMGLYVFTINAFFNHSRPEVQTEQSVMMIAHVFVTLLGLVLMLVTLPLLTRTTSTYNNLMLRCGQSSETHRLYEYAQVLQNIRRLPGCVGKFSVEECEGYSESPPYTNYLRDLENRLHCSGFCHQPTSDLSMSSGVALEANVSSGSAEAKAAAAAASLHSMFTEPTTPQFPPALFSDRVHKASCESMAARDLKTSAGGVGAKLFDQGLYFVGIAIGIGFLKLVNFCNWKKRDAQYADPGSGFRNP